MAAVGFYKTLWDTGLFTTSTMQRCVHYSENSVQVVTDSATLLTTLRSGQPRPPFASVKVRALIGDSNVSISNQASVLEEQTSTLAPFIEIIRKSPILTTARIHQMVLQMVAAWNSIDSFSTTLDLLSYTCLLLIYHSIASPNSPISSPLERWITSNLHMVSKRHFSEALGTLLAICKGNLTDIEVLIAQNLLALKNLAQYEKSLAFIMGMAHTYTFLQGTGHKYDILSTHIGTSKDATALSLVTIKTLPSNTCLLQYQYMDLLAIVMSTNLWNAQACNILIEFLDHLQALSNQAGYNLRTSMRTNPHGFIGMSIIRLCSRLKSFITSSLITLKARSNAQQKVANTLRIVFQRLQTLIADGLSGLATCITKGTVPLKDLRDTYPNMYPEFVRPYMCAFIIFLDVCAYIRHTEIDILLDWSDIQEAVTIFWRSLVILDVPALARQDISKDFYFQASTGFYYNSLTEFVYNRADTSGIVTDIADKLSVVNWAALFKHLAFHTETNISILTCKKILNLELEIMPANVAHLRSSMIAEFTASTRTHRKTSNIINSIPDGYICNFYSLVLIEIYSALCIDQETSGIVASTSRKQSVVSRLSQYNTYGYLSREAFETIIQFDSVLADAHTEDEGSILFTTGDFKDVPLYFSSSSGSYCADNCIISMGSVCDVPLDGSEKAVNISPKIFFQFYAELFVSVYEHLTAYLTLAELITYQEVVHKWAPAYSAMDPEKKSRTLTILPESDAAISFTLPDVIYHKFVFETVSLLKAAEESASLININIYLELAGILLHRLPDIKFSPVVLYHYLRTGISILIKFNLIYGITASYFASIMTSPFLLEQLLTSTFIYFKDTDIMSLLPAIQEFITRLLNDTNLLLALKLHITRRQALKHLGASLTIDSLVKALFAVPHHMILRFTRHTLTSPISGILDGYGAQSFFICSHGAFTSMLTEMREYVRGKGADGYKDMALKYFKDLFNLLYAPTVRFVASSDDSERQRAKWHNYIVLPREFLCSYLLSPPVQATECPPCVLVPTTFGFMEIITVMHAVCIDASAHMCGVQLSIYFSFRLLSLVNTLQQGKTRFMRPVVRSQNTNLETSVEHIKQPTNPDVSSSLLDSDVGHELLSTLLLFAMHEQEINLNVHSSLFYSDFMHKLAATWPVELHIPNFTTNTYISRRYPCINLSTSPVAPIITPLKETSKSGYTILITLRAVKNMLHENQLFVHNANNLHLRAKYRLEMFKYHQKILISLGTLCNKSTQQLKASSRRSANMDASTLLFYIDFYYTKAAIALFIVNFVFLLRCDKSNLLLYTDKYLVSCLFEVYHILSYFCNTALPDQQKSVSKAERQNAMFMGVRFSQELTFYRNKIAPIVSSISLFSISNPALLYDTQMGKGGFHLMEESSVHTSILRILSILGRRYNITLDTGLRMIQNYIPVMDAAKTAIGWFIDVVQTYLQPLRTVLPGTSKVFTIPFEAEQHSTFLSGNSLTMQLTSNAPSALAPINSILWSYQNQEILFPKSWTCQEACTSFSYDDVYVLTHCTAYLQATSFLNNVTYRQFMNPCHLSRTRADIEEMYQQKHDSGYIDSLVSSFIFPDKAPLSAEIIANATSVMSLLKLLATIRLVNPNVMMAFADMVGKQGLYTDIITYTKSCMLLADDRSENWYEYPTATLELHASLRTCILSKKHILSMEAPSISVACSLINNCPFYEVRYISSLLFYYLSHIGKNKVILAYLLFLTNTLHTDMFAGSLLINVASHSRLFGLYTLIQLSSMYSKVVSQQQNEIFFTIAVDSIVSEKLLRTLRTITLDMIIMYLYMPKTFQKATEQATDKSHMAVRDKVLKELSVAGVTADSIRTNLRRLFQFMSSDTKQVDSKNSALYQQLIQSTPAAQHIVIRAYLLYILILLSGSTDDITFYINNLHFYDTMTSFSAELLRINPSDRDKVLMQKLKEFSMTINSSHNIILLSDPDYVIAGICYQKAKCLKSHAKVPYLVCFTTIKKDISSADLPVATNTKVKPVIKGGIFKAGDDVSQDQLTMVLISLFKQLLEPLRVWLSPYTALPIGRDDGFIELLNRASSLDQIGSSSDTFLVGYLNSITSNNKDLDGADSQDDPKLTTALAKRRFLLSSVGYSILSYLLSFKDRHNGNIMLTEDCNIIHIDFGFLLNIAPGGRFNTERAPFKLTKAFETILGGEGSTSYTLFQYIFVRGIVLSKLFGRDLSYLIEAVVTSDLPAIKGRGSVIQFRQRMFLEDSLSATAEQAIQLVIESSRRGYGAYDKFQSWQNKIAYG